MTEMDGRVTVKKKTNKQTLLTTTNDKIMWRAMSWRELLEDSYYNEW